MPPTNSAIEDQRHEPESDDELAVQVAPEQEQRDEHPYGLSAAHQVSLDEQSVSAANANVNICTRGPQIGNPATTAIEHAETEHTATRVAQACFLHHRR